MKIKNKTYCLVKIALLVAYKAFVKKELAHFVCVSQNEIDEVKPHNVYIYQDTDLAISKKYSSVLQGKLKIIVSSKCLITFSWQSSDRYSKMVYGKIFISNEHKISGFLDFIKSKHARDFIWEYVKPNYCPFFN